MTVVSYSALRVAIAANISAAGFNLAKMTPDYFGRVQDTIAHKAFTVSISNSNANPERQRRAVGVYVTTNVIVQFAYRLRPLDIYPTDYDLALDAEITLTNATLNTYANTKEFTLQYVNSIRTITDSQEYMITTLTFTAQHTI